MIIQLANLTIHISNIIHNWYCFQATNMDLDQCSSQGTDWSVLLAFNINISPEISYLHLSSSSSSRPCTSSKHLWTGITLLFRSVLMAGIVVLFLNIILIYSQPFTH